MLFFIYLLATFAGMHIRNMFSYNSHASQYVLAMDSIGKFILALTQLAVASYGIYKENIPLVTYYSYYIYQLGPSIYLKIYYNS